MSTSKNLKYLSFNKLFYKAKKLKPKIKYRSTTKQELIDIITSPNNEIRPLIGSGLNVFPNEDKGFHESWTKNRKVLNLPHPFRCILCGPPNVGKTSYIFNLLMNNRPYFEEVIVIHCDAEYTKEYDGLNVILCNEIPAPSEFDGELKTLVILDDLEYSLMPKEEKRNLDRLFGFVSTHKNISVCLTSQDVFNIPCGVRRCSNVWVLWKILDADSIKVLSRKIGLTSKNIQKLFDKYLVEEHDSLMIDNTEKSPYKLRKNGTQIINFSDI